MHVEIKTYKTCSVRLVHTYLDKIFKSGELRHTHNKTIVEDSPEMQQMEQMTKRIPATQIQEVAKALSGDLRLRILEVLGNEAMSISQLMQALGAAQPTISINVQILEQAGLIETTTSSNREKICTRLQDTLLIELPNRPGEALEEMEEIHMPIGMFTACYVRPTCGLASKDNIIGSPDDPRTFYLPERSEAGLLWFGGSGYVEYQFPNPVPPGKPLMSLSCSVELCSEAHGYSEDWPSDITLFINGMRIGTITCQGDFGENKGKLTPNWWVFGTQHGVLTQWSIDEKGSYLNGERCSNIGLADLGLNFQSPIKVRFEVEDTAHNKRGLNLFGASFGNYAQDIILSFNRPI